MTFKYTAEDEYHLEEILHSMFSKDLVTSTSSSQRKSNSLNQSRIRKNKILIELITGVSEFDIITEANNYFTSIIERYESNNINPKNLELNIEKEKSRLLSQSRFNTEAFTFSFTQNYEPLLFAEILLWAKKEGFVYDFLKSPFEKHPYDIEIVKHPNYDTVQKTVKYLQDAFADILSEDLNLDDYGIENVFEKEKAKIEIDNIQNEIIYPMPIVRFERVSSKREDREVYNVSDIVQESVCLFTMPSENFDNTITDNGLYVYKLGSREIFEFILAEDFKESLNSLKDFARYINQ
jgi:hypothetical protein